MTTKAADDFDSIAQRLKEIQAAKDEARTGTSAPVQEQKDETPSGYGDYLVWSPSAFNDAVREYLAQKNQYQAVANDMKSLAHPNWPYAGTGFEWRRFVRS